jgi:hypothetical protein
MPGGSLAPLAALSLGTRLVDRDRLSGGALLAAAPNWATVTLTHAAELAKQPHPVPALPKRLARTNAGRASYRRAAFWW